MGLAPTNIYYDKSSEVAEMGDSLATIDMGRKWEGTAMPFSVGELPPGPKPTSVPSGVLIHPTVWPQHTNVTDRQTDKTAVPLLVMVAQKRPQADQMDFISPDFVASEYGCVCVSKQNHVA